VTEWVIRTRRAHPGRSGTPRRGLLACGDVIVLSYDIQVGHESFNPDEDR
jgi:hypothetical protein